MAINMKYFGAREDEVIHMIMSIRTVRLQGNVPGMNIWIFRPPLQPDEYQLVKDRVRISEKDGKRHMYVTGNPYKVFKKLLDNGKLRLDFMLAMKMIAAERAGEPGLLAVAKYVYKALVLDKRMNEDKVEMLRNAEFRGELNDWLTIMRIQDSRIVADGTPRIINGGEYAIQIFKDMKTGSRYVAMFGSPYLNTPIQNKDIRFPTYAIIWDANLVSSRSDRELMEAFKLGYNAEVLAAGVGEVIEELEEKDTELRAGVLAVISRIMNYDVITDTINEEKYGLHVMFKLPGENSDMLTEIYDTIDEAKGAARKIIEAFKEAKEEALSNAKEAEKFKKLMEQYEKSNEDAGMYM